MIVILTGAIKNVGDYLIGSRARKLLREFVDEDIVELNRFKLLDEHLETINKARAVFLCGGPAYAKNLYPGIYPLVSNLDDIKVPVIPFGLGWSGKPFGKPEQFSFTNSSVKFLDSVHKHVDATSCRDEITESILNRLGYDNVIMTGCPVWYDLDSIGKELSTDPIKKIVFTTPAKPSLIRQNHKLMKELRNQFPDAELICSFHRGIGPDKYTSYKKGAFYTGMALNAKMLGYKVVDVAYGVDQIDFYKACDLHVGYRVHAHLDFLSRRKPTVLINEDGRGQGMAKTLGLPVLNYNDKAMFHQYRHVLENIKQGKVDDLKAAISVIEEKFEVMKTFLKSIK